MGERDKEGKAVPKVSVIVPMYDCGPYIEECLESLKAQSLGDFEAICVDDASSDDTVGRAKACIDGDPRFSVLTLTENRGQGAARNVALDRAQGEYIVLLDADDYLVPDALEKLWRRAVAQDLDDLYFAGRSFYDSQDTKGLIWEGLDERTPFEEVADGRTLFTLLKSRGEFFPHAALRMVKRSLIEGHGIRFYEGIIHEDALFTFQTLVVSERSSFLSDAVYMRRIRPGSTMTARTQGIATVVGHFVCVREMKRWMKAHAQELDSAFIEAMMGQIDAFAHWAGYDWCRNEDSQAKAAYLASLTNEEKVDFYADVVYRGESEKRTEDGILQSRPYRVGDALLKGPRLIKHKIQGR